MLRKLAGNGLFLLLLVLGGCVVYDPYPGYYYDYPQYSPRYHYWGPPMEFRYHHHRGGWHDGLNQEDGALKLPFRLGFQDEPLMCPDPGSRTLPTG
ncbi:hypothetical protein SKTS_27270 [Sulfurimicrobium lacus]|uniref:Lipoprotein n=1 Tax=Sulfurimicrobium lacus TaxID=2715678 RepID=A0A6F8VFB0_9PROT|nr:hypothetical protein [Sulfurimicrobium lacus]BCB27841.1 hypothetical protein SKTS_27270 [Sulfurimicrobium lacus]